MRDVVATARETFERSRRFFTQEIWHAKLEELPRGRAMGYRAARIAHTTGRALLFSDVLHVRSAALTYFTVLSVVPMLAFVFAILKGFGAYDALVEQTIRPYVLATFEGNAALQDAMERILSFVSDTGVTSLGFLGLVTLMYAATRLLRNIEVTMNELWEVPSGRGPLRQLTDYAAILMVTPMCLLLAAGLGTATQVLDMVRHAAAWVGMEGAVNWAIGVGSPLLVITLGFFVLYEIMPNTSVSYRSAAVGAVVGAILWYTSLIVHVRFQVGVANYNALYSSFGVIPIFLVWVYVSWLMVLVGAQVAASHQFSRGLARKRRAEPLGQRLEEVTGLSVLLQVAESFRRGDAHPDLAALRERLDLPEEVLNEVLSRLTRAGLVLPVNEGEDTRYVLGRAPEGIRVTDVLDTLRGSQPPPADSVPPGDPVAHSVLRALDEAQVHSEHNVTLAELQEDRRTHQESGEHHTRGVA